MCTATSNNVLTSQYSNQRQGANVNENCLTPTNVVTGNMPEQIQFLVPTNPGACSGSPSIANCCPSGVFNPVYTQPLYFYQANVTGAEGGKANLVIVTTLNDQIFAYDASTRVTGNPCSASGSNYSGYWYWTRNLISDLGTSGDCNSGGAGEPISDPGQSLPTAGVLSTPLIYSTGQILYVMGGCESTTDGIHHWYLHGLNLADGTDSFTPIDVGANVYVPSAGGAAGATVGCTVGCTLGFNAAYQLQRAALLLANNGELFVAFAVGGGSGSSENDWTWPYHGWLIGYRVQDTLNTTATFAFASTPNYDSTNTTTPCSNVPSNSNTNITNQCGLGGGIWMSGKGPAIYTSGESTYVVVGTGNGGVLAGGSLPGWGSSVVSFLQGTTCTTTSSPTQCSPAEFYTPSDYTTLNNNDQDMGNSGVVVTDTLTGGASELVAFDKTGKGYVLNPGSLPGYSTSDCTDCKFEGSLTATSTTCNGPGPQCDPISSPVYWNSWLFVWPRGEDLDWCYWDSGLFSCQPNKVSYSDDGLEPSGFPGGSLVVSANCTAGCALSGSNAILWGIATKSTAVPYVEPDTDPGDFQAKLKAYWLETNPPLGGTPNFLVEEIWSSPAFLGSIFAQPTIINGRAYVPTYDNGVEVFYPEYQNP
jgi:hypothetical protein